MKISELLESTYNTSSSLEILVEDTEEVIETFDTVQDAYAKMESDLSNKEIKAWCCDEHCGEIRLNVYIEVE